MKVDQKLNLANDVILAGKPDPETAIHLIHLLRDIIVDLQKEITDLGGDKWKIPNLKKQ